MGVVEMRRHYANYFKGYAHFKEYRTHLVGAQKPDDVREILRELQEVGPRQFATVDA